MQIFCPRCGGYTPPRVRFCKICGGNVASLRESMEDVLGAPLSAMGAALTAAAGGPVSARVGAVPSEAPRPAPQRAAPQRVAAPPPPPPEPEPEPDPMPAQELPSPSSPDPFGLGSGAPPIDPDGLLSLGGGPTGGLPDSLGAPNLDAFNLGNPPSGGIPFALDDKQPLGGFDLAGPPSGGVPFDLGPSPQSPLENLDLSIAPPPAPTPSGSGGGGAPFDLGSLSSTPDFGSLGEFGVSGAGKVDFGDLDSGVKQPDKGLFDLDSLAASAIPTSASAIPTGPEPEIDFSLLSNPDKKKVLKSLEDLDFSKSELSGSGASKLLDGDLDFTGLSSPATFKGTEDNLYNMDEIPSLGGTKGPSDDPFATLLNQPARQKAKPESLINPSEVAEVERELNRVSGGAPPAAGGSDKPLHVVLYQGNRAVKKWPLKDGETTIGQQDPDAKIFPDVDLAEYDSIGLVTPLHAKIIKEGPKLFVVDTMKSTGTQLNGKALSKESRTQMKPGDTIGMAQTITLKVE